MTFPQRRSFSLMMSDIEIHFGDKTVKSLVIIVISLAKPPGIPVIPITPCIVPADVPALLGIDILDSKSLYADTVTDCLVHR